jgi:hypothetical protein
MTHTENTILTPTSPGELIDKITVLKIKSERIEGKLKLANINRELALLEKTREEHFPKDQEFTNRILVLELALKKANEEIWDMGEKIRELGGKKDFGPEFIEVAYGIHIANDHRASVKKDINLLFGSSLIEEKSYKDWK